MYQNAEEISKHRIQNGQRMCASTENVQLLASPTSNSGASPLHWQRASWHSTCGCRLPQTDVPQHPSCSHSTIHRYKLMMHDCISMTIRSDIPNFKRQLKGDWSPSNYISTKHEPCIICFVIWPTTQIWNLWNFQNIFNFQKIAMLIDLKCLEVRCCLLLACPIIHTGKHTHTTISRPSRFCPGQDPQYTSDCISSVSAVSGR